MDGFPSDVFFLVCGGAQTKLGASETRSATHSGRHTDPLRPQTCSPADHQSKVEFSGTEWVRARCGTPDVSSPGRTLRLKTRLGDGHAARQGDVGGQQHLETAPVVFVRPADGARDVVAPVDEALRRERTRVSRRQQRFVVNEQDECFTSNTERPKGRSR